jgi:hypothetical protein
MKILIKKKVLNINSIPHTFHYTLSSLGKVHYITFLNKLLKKKKIKENLN